MKNFMAVVNRKPWRNQTPNGFFGLINIAFFCGKIPIIESIVIVHPVLTGECHSKVYVTNEFAPTV